MHPLKHPYAARSLRVVGTMPDQPQLARLQPCWEVVCIAGLPLPMVSGLTCKGCESATSCLLATVLHVQTSLCQHMPHRH